jgi:cobalt-zinc-cadmium efflux system protein
VDEWPVLIVAAASILVNGATAWLFLSGAKHDLNIRGALLHMAADALVSLGVVMGAVVVLATGWMWLDPAISLVIAAVVVWGTWSLFSQSLHLLFDGVPQAVDLPAVRGKLLALPGVVGLHDVFEITHVTLQIEPQTFAAQCALAASAAAWPGRVTSEQIP